VGTVALATILADALAALAVAILRWWAGRQDVRNLERAKLALAAAEAANRALVWKADARPESVERIRVRADAPALRLPGIDPDSLGDPAHDPLPGGRPADRLRRPPP
jgi:hypothetical protein